MSETSIHEELPSVLQTALKRNLGEMEPVLLQIKGAFKEALVCTDRRVMILKSGFMTGQMFGSDIFQLPYPNVASAEVKYRILSGYFEISTGGMQNTSKSYWSQDKTNDPAKAPNCVALNSRSQADKFRSACAFIMEQITRAKTPVMPNVPKQDEMDISSAIERLWKLKMDGALSQEEFDAGKRKLLSA